MVFFDPSEHKLYDPVGHCIYCGLPAWCEDPTDEHIVPYFLGGNAILQKSSCWLCADATKYVEGYCANNIFKQVRVKERIQTRRPKERPATFPLITEFDDGEAFQEVPVQDHPSLFLMPAYTLPGILLGITASDKWPEVRFRMFWSVLNRQRLEQNIKAQGGTAVRVEGTQKAALLPRLLAKIAHAYAIAELGETNFRPLLLRLIRKGQLTAPYLVGGELDVAPSTPAFHELSHEIRRVDNRNYLIVRIRLLAYLEAPVYYVVVGEMGSPNWIWRRMRIVKSCIISFALRMRLRLKKQFTR
jgi:hypothetical protein